MRAANHEGQGADYRSADGATRRRTRERQVTKHATAGSDAREERKQETAGESSQGSGEVLRLDFTDVYRSAD